MGRDLDLAVAGLADGDVVAQVVGAALDLDAVLQELLKGRHVEDLVAGRLLRVDDELGSPKRQPRPPFLAPSLPPPPQLLVLSHRLRPPPPRLPSRGR